MSINKNILAVVVECLRVIVPTLNVVEAPLEYLAV